MRRRDSQVHWEADSRHTEDGPHYGGQTALVVLALLHAGKSPQEPGMREPIEWLAGLDLQGVYSRSLRAAVWAQMPPAYLPRLQADATWLQQAFSRQVDGWSYRMEPTTSRLDNSTTQYGCLGLWEAAKRGINIPPEYWRRLEDRFIDEQQADGGWTYGRTGPPRGSMTAAGLTVLYITRDLLHADKFLELRPDWKGEEALQAGLRWMTEHYDPASHPGLNQYYTYYLYGVERVGLAGGMKYFGEADWFRTGSAALIRFLTAHPRGEPKRTRVNVSTVDLAFGLLFLSRGRVPVVINKLEIDDFAWNNRPRDAAALARFLSDDIEEILNWQVVPVTSAVDDWLDAPLVYIASHEPLPWTVDSEEAGKLREYMLRGGLLVFATEAGSRRFDRSVEDLLTGILPDYQWRKLERSHELLQRPFEIDSSRLEVRGLRNGIRELAVLITGRDAPAVLQATYGRPRNAQENEVYELISNLKRYASGMHPLPPRLAGLAMIPEPRDDPSWGLRLGLVQHDGDWNPEPLAWDRFAASLRASQGGALEVQPIDISALPDPKTMPLLMLQGIEPVDFDDARVAALLDYAERGGVVLVQTVGGQGRFARDLEQRFAIASGSSATFLRDHPLITGEGLRGASDCRTVGYTASAWLRFGHMERRPRLRAIFLEGEPRLIFTGEDLTHALLGRPSTAVSGYDSDSAARLLSNILALVR